LPDQGRAIDKPRRKEFQFFMGQQENTRPE
jgi:hypothetical protein